MKLAPWLLFLVIAGASCDDDDDAIRIEVQSLTLLEGSPSLAAAAHLARHGRRVLAPIEAALHTADVAGRKNLLLAIRKLGEGEAVPLLRHLALYDAAPDVRREAEWTLRSWAAERNPRGDQARDAIRKIEEAHGKEGTG